MAELFAPSAPASRLPRLRSRPGFERSALALALAAASTGGATQAQEQAAPSAQTRATGVASAAARAVAQVSRPRWQASGSSVAPARVPVLETRATAAPTPRLSHAWIAEAEAVGPLALGAAREGSPSGPAPAAASVTAGTSSPLRVEVPLALPGMGSGDSVGKRLPTARNPAPTPPATEREEERRTRLAAIERQRHFERAQADKKRKEQEMMDQAEANLARAHKRVRVARVNLDQSINSLPQFQRVLHNAFLDAGPDAAGLHPFVQAAKKYAGTPYVWGGESRGGFDCSGFIIVVMRDLGYKALPHSAAEQFKYGAPVATRDLKPGDLVFFQNTYKPGISHVGIYLGRGKFIHAAGTGKGTIVSYLGDASYAAKYAGARRLFRVRG